MSLYGNIASTAPFQFDRIFGSRSEMDQIGTPEDKFVDDGVYAGRYVLVKYDTKLESAIPVATLLNRNNEDVTRLLKFLDAKYAKSIAQNEIFILYQGDETVKASTTNPSLVANQIYAAKLVSPPTKDLNQYFFFEYTGDFDEKDQTAKFKIISASKINDENKSKYLYPLHYAQDRANYETIDTQASAKGYDGTIWMKTYIEVEDKDGVKYKEQYIYVGSLNASMPALKVTPEAPEGGFRLPHLSTTESDTYDLHITTPYGFRVGKTSPETVSEKDSNGQLIPTFDENGNPTGGYASVADSTIQWKSPAVSDTDDNKTIYYNKAGFDVTKNNIDKETSNLLTCDLTGYSGQRYAVCDAAGKTEEKAMPDIYELQMRLPALGNAVAELWNLAYGEDRNLDIAWEDGANPKRFGKRLIPIGTENYTPQQANTIAGCINSMHDLMGMIIVNDDADALPVITDENPKALDNYGLSHIYYFSKLGKFYRVEQAPYFNESNKLVDDDFDYTKANVDSSTYVPNLYYDANHNPITNKEYSDGTKYTKQLSNKGKEKAFAKIPNAEMLDPKNNKIYELINNNYFYVSSDLIVDGKTYYSFTPVKKEAKMYHPGSYYYKFNKNGECFILDESPKMDANKAYFTSTVNPEYSITNADWLPHVRPKFYYSSAIAAQAEKKLYTLLKKKYKDKYGDAAEISNQISSVFFYKENDIYQPFPSKKVTEIEADRKYYIGAEWDRELDWDNENHKFVYLYRPTQYVEAKLINASDNIFYYDTGMKGWRRLTFTVDESILDSSDLNYVTFLAENICYNSTTDSSGKKLIPTDYQYRTFNSITLTDGTTIKNAYIESAGNYLLATADDLDKTHGEYWELTQLKTLKYIYQPNKYYYKANNEFILDTRASKDTNTSTWYIKKDILIKDSAGYYPDYSIWNIDTRLIPSTVDLYVADTKSALVELESFARQLNTAHGLILKINQTLDLSNTNTREDATVKGIMNKMDDILNKFAVMQPGDFVIVDGYGRMHGAELSGSKWIDVKVKPDPVSPTVTFEHADPGAEGIWTTPTIQLNDTQQAVVMAAKIDNKGHLDSKSVTGVDPGNLLFTVRGITRSFADWITWAANQGGGTNTVVTDWIAPDPSALSFSIDKGRLRNNDETDTEDIWTLSTSIDTNNKKALEIAEITSQTVALTTTSDYAALLPINKQFTLTLGYHDNNKFSNDYTATTVNTKTFDVDMREGLAALDITQGTNDDQHLFTPKVVLDSKARCVEVKVSSDATLVASTEIAPANYIVGTAINLDTLFNGKLIAGTAYKVTFKAISNNEAYKDSAILEFNYTYQAGLPAPTLSVADYASEAGAIEVEGQRLSWTTVTRDGITDIKYILKKDGKEILSEVTTLEYILLKANANSKDELNGVYTVFAQGMRDGKKLLSGASNAITVNWFKQLDAPVVAAEEQEDDEFKITTISWEAIDNATSYNIYRNANEAVFNIITGRTSDDLQYNGAYTVKACAAKNYRYYDSELSNVITITNGKELVGGISSNLGAAVTYQPVTSETSLADEVSNIYYQFGSSVPLSNGMSMPTASVTWNYYEQTTSDGEKIYGSWSGMVGGFKIASSVTTEDGVTHNLLKTIINGVTYTSSIFGGSQLFNPTAILEGKTICSWGWDGASTFTGVWDNGADGNPSGFAIELIYDNVHNWVKNESKSVAATCVPGSNVYECKGDGDATCSHSASNIGTKTETAPAAYGHNWGEWQVITQPTETTDGEQYRDCLNGCGSTETEIIPATGSEHEYSTEWSYDRTNHWHACTKTGHTDTKDVTAHDYNNHTGGINGLGGCTVCNYVCDHTTDGHTDAEKWTATKDAEGNWNYSGHTMMCSLCGFVDTGHEPHEWDENNKCVCGLDRTQHNHGFTDNDWVIDTAATTTSTGSKHRTCTVCGYTETATIPKLDVLKLATPSLVNKSTSDTCKFSFTRDTRAEFGKYYTVIYVSIDGGEKTPCTNWDADYNDPVYTVTMKSSYFTKYNATYSITVIAKDQSGTYSDSDESNAITFTTSAPDKLTTPVLTNLSSGNVCKFSFPGDGRVTTYHVYVDGQELAGVGTGWNYSESNGIFTITMVPNWVFSQCDTDYSITAQAYSSDGSYQDSDISNPIIFHYDHNYTVTQEATCQNGTTKVCSNTYQGKKCEKTVVDTTKDMSNHTSIDYKYEQGSTAGTHNYITYCSDCGTTISSSPQNCDWKKADGTCTKCKASHTHACNANDWDANTGTGPCNTCGYIMTCSHERRTLNSAANDDTYHYYVCDQCGKDIPEKHTFDTLGNCTANCGYSDKTKCQHPARFLTYKHTGGADEHTVTCENCGHTDTEDCTPGTTVISTQGCTATKQGYTEYACSKNCGNTGIRVYNQCRDNDRDGLCDTCGSKMQ